MNEYNIIKNMSNAIAQAVQWLSPLDPAKNPILRKAELEKTGYVYNRIADVVTFLYTIFFLIAVLFIILAAFNFLTAQGDETKIKTAKSQLYWAVVAIVVALLAVAVKPIIKSFLL